MHEKHHINSEVHGHDFICMATALNSDFPLLFGIIITFTHGDTSSSNSSLLSLFIILTFLTLHVNTVCINVFILF